MHFSAINEPHISVAIKQTFVNIVVHADENE